MRKPAVDAGHREPAAQTVGKGGLDMSISRRGFGRLAGATAALVAAPAYLRAADKPRVVVVGGGAGGATAARYIARDSGGALSVTLVEPQTRFTTCFFSNLYLGGFTSFEKITHGYDGVRAAGVDVVHQAAASIDRDRREVVLADGARLPYDRLVLSPGIEILYDSVPGYSAEAAEIMPHAWKAGPQTTLLKAKLDAVEDGQTIVMVAPPNPYRCPPGPYERASMMAHVLTAQGFTRSRIIILDAKPSFSKQALFQEGWASHYPGMIEWIPPEIHGGVKQVDPAAGRVETELDDFDGALVNVIPAQAAGRIATEAGLADDSRYCPIEAASMRSAIDPAIFVIGDACSPGDMPKSAFSANSQAKVAAMTVRADLTGSELFPARYTNTCWSLIDTDDAVKVGGRYAPAEGRIASQEGFISQPGETADLRRSTYLESLDWYASITADIFG